MTAKDQRRLDLERSDHAIALGEALKFKTRLEWLGDPKNIFSYSVCANGSVKVDTRYMSGWWPTLAAALDDAMVKFPAYLASEEAYRLQQIKNNEEAKKRFLGKAS